MEMGIGESSPSPGKTTQQEPEQELEKPNTHFDHENLNYACGSVIGAFIGDSAGSLLEFAP